MPNDQEQISNLLQKLELLLKKQQDFNIEVNEIRRDIQILRNTQALNFNEEAPTQQSTPQKEIFEENPIEIVEQEIIQPAVESFEAPIITSEENKISFENKTIKPKEKSNIEKFIGENLINKIGILITVIGVVIGAKYSIENNLISPLTRIVLGYLIGLGLLGFGFKLKAKYENYSAVLVSGSIAILYFITFAAYDLYELFPQLMAFGIMLLCTVFGVVAAISYNKQVIAHIGLVGAYAVPFLLSNGSGNATALFSYIALINIGLLVISFKKYWKALYYVSFVFTWLIYATWYFISSYKFDENFFLGFTFLAIFFFLFYATFLAFKLIKSEKFQVGDIILILLNSFIFYGFGIAWLYDYEGGELYLGLFTVFNALIHFAITVIIFKRKLADRKLFFLTSGFVLTFLTIAVPVQLDGNWVTLIWAFEAALLFWIGRTKKAPFYEYLSYIMSVLSVLSLTMDWAEAYSWIGITENEISPFLNITFLSSLLCAAAYGFILFFQTKFTLEKKSLVNNIMVVGMPAIFLFTLFCVFYLEIEHYWDNLFHASKIDLTGTDDYNIEHNYNVKDLKSIWLLLYSMFFVSALGLTNTLRIKNKALGITALCAALLMTFSFLTNGLYILSELRENYISQELIEFYDIGAYNIYMRYISFAFFALLMYTIYKLAQQDYFKINNKIPFEILLHISIIWIASSELVNWMDLSGSEQSYKLGLSIFWGIYALLLIVLGIWKKKKHLRIGAISLFSITLVKLFFYDIASLNTISKTIVFVSLGVLLLIISFLYNKYKHIISDDNK